jgi:hypothetical protein
MTLTEFLLARIDEDKFVAAHEEVRKRLPFAYPLPPIRWEPARVLADCAAKRAILAEHEPYDTEDGGVGIVCSSCAGGGGFNTDWPCRTVLVVAAVYADHPDYQPEWKSALP